MAGVLWPQPTDNRDAQNLRQLYERARPIEVRAPRPLPSASFADLPLLAALW